jgi:hypothetical protein
LENKIIIKNEKGVETWLKKQTLSMDTKEWIEFQNHIYEIEKFDEEDSL